MMLLKNLLIIIITVAVTVLSVSSEELPEIVYKRYIEALDERNITEIMGIVSSSKREEMEDLPEDKLKAVLDIISVFTPSDIRIHSRTIYPDGLTASINMTGTSQIDGKMMYGEVIFVKEGTGWKIDSESWSDKEPDDQYE